MFLQAPLPQKEELIVALSDQPLGNGSEACVYKIHTSPQYTLRVSQDLLNKENLSKKIMASELIPEKDVFHGRKYGQTVAYLKHPELMDSYSQDPMITVNYYSKGHDYTVVKDLKENPTPQETLDRTIAITKMLVDEKMFPDSAYDTLFDDLKFLSSCQYTIDVGNGLFCNTGNILPSVQDHRFFIIDVMPFIPSDDLKLAPNPRLNPNHTKGFNSPLFLAKGLMYGYLPHQQFHCQNSELLELRTKLLSRVVHSAKRSMIDDHSTYLFDSTHSWHTTMSQLSIPESDQNTILHMLSEISDTQPYQVTRKRIDFARIGGMYINQQ